MIDVSWLAGLHIPAWLLSDTTLWVCNILYALVVLIALRHVIWREFIANTRQQHVFFGAIVLLLLMWGFKAGITPGLGFHHLGATLFTLMFGWPRAIAGLTIVLLASYGLITPDWPSMGVNGLLSIVAPVAVSYGILRMSWRYLPDNFFIYIFINAFFGAAIAVAVSRFSATLVLYFAGAYPFEVLVEQSLSYLPLFMFPEAFVTGLLITIFVVYLPEWVSTFDDERYLRGK